MILLLGVLPVGDKGLELTDHASIPTGSTPAKMPPQDQRDIFDDEGPSIEPKADTGGGCKEK